MSMRIHSVLKVSAYSAGGGERLLEPFNTFSQRDTYNLRIRASSIDAQGYDHYLSLPYSEGKVPGEMTLSIGLLCTNGKLPESLRLGDLNQPTDNTPPRVEFKSIRGITPCQPPKFDDKLLWRMLSQLNANHFRLADRDYLRGLLALYLPSGRRRGPGRQPAAHRCHRKSHRQPRAAFYSRAADRRQCGPGRVPGRLFPQPRQFLPVRLCAG